MDSIAGKAPPHPFPLPQSGGEGKGVGVKGKRLNAFGLILRLGKPQVFRDDLVAIVA